MRQLSATGSIGATGAAFAMALAILGMMLWMLAEMHADDPQTPYAAWIVEHMP